VSFIVVGAGEWCCGRALSMPNRWVQVELTVRGEGGSVTENAVKGLIDQRCSLAEVLSAGNRRDSTRSHFAGVAGLTDTDAGNELVFR
jgi:hypothetical protein